MKKHDDDTIAYCLKNGITYNAFGVMRGCLFTDPTVAALAKKYKTSAAQASQTLATPSAIPGATAQPAAPAPAPAAAAAAAAAAANVLLLAPAPASVPATQYGRLAATSESKRDYGLPPRCLAGAPPVGSSAAPSAPPLPLTRQRSR